MPPNPGPAIPIASARFFRRRRASRSRSPARSRAEADLLSRDQLRQLRQGRVADHAALAGAGKRRLQHPGAISAGPIRPVPPPPGSSPPSRRRLQPAPEGPVVERVEDPVPLPDIQVRLIRRDAPEPCAHQPGREPGPRQLLRRRPSRHERHDHSAYRESGWGLSGLYFFTTRSSDGSLRDTEKVERRPQPDPRHAEHHDR